MEEQAVIDPFELVIMLLAVVGGTLAAAVILPMWLPGLATSLLGGQPKAYWYLARTSGFVAFIMLWLSVSFGLTITNKLARLWNGGPAVVDLHQFTTWLAVATALFHALILTGDQYIKSTVAQVAVPFGYVNYRPEWVGLGQLAFYLTIIVAVSFYFRKRMGYQAWRWLHYTSFVVYILITLHGIFSGTDFATLMAVYVCAGMAVFFLTLYRVLYSPKADAPAHRPVTARPAGASAAQAQAGHAASARPASAAASASARPAAARVAAAPAPIQAARSEASSPQAE